MSTVIIYFSCTYSILIMQHQIKLIKYENTLYHANAKIDSILDSKSFIHSNYPKTQIVQLIFYSIKNII